MLSVNLDTGELRDLDESRCMGLGLPDGFCPVSDIDTEQWASAIMKARNDSCTGTTIKVKSNSKPTVTVPACHFLDSRGAIAKKAARMLGASSDDQIVLSLERTINWITPKVAPLDKIKANDIPRGLDPEDVATD